MRPVLLWNSMQPLQPYQIAGSSPNFSVLTQLPATTSGDAVARVPVTHKEDLNGVLGFKLAQP